MYYSGASIQGNTLPTVDTVDNCLIRGVNTKNVKIRSPILRLYTILTMQRLELRIAYSNKLYNL